MLVVIRFELCCKTSCVVSAKVLHPVGINQFPQGRDKMIACIY
jgi:hypothetical protein